MTDTKKLSFGIEPSTRGVETDTAWGARTILRDGTIDIVWDRKDARGMSHSYPFIKWLDEKALPYLRHLAEKSDNFPYGSENRDVEICGDGFYMVANPQASHGYLYIGAWPSSKPEHQAATPIPPKPARRSKTIGPSLRGGLARRR